MKYVALFCFIFFIALQSYAQQDSRKLLYIEKSEKYRKMKNTGSVLTILGAGLVVVGLVTITKSIDTNNNTTGTAQNSADGNLATGFAEYLVGAGCLGSGIPLWIVGAHAQRKYERKLINLSVGFNIGPQTKGLRLTYRF